MDLSLVTARRHEVGEIAREKIVALSMPLRSSVIKRDVAVEYTRIKVPYMVLVPGSRKPGYLEKEMIKLQFQMRLQVCLLEAR